MSQYMQQPFLLHCRNIESETVINTAKSTFEQRPVKFEVNPACEEMVFNDVALIHDDFTDSPVLHIP